MGSCIEDDQLTEGARREGEMTETGFERDVRFIFELGSLRHVQRTWVQFGGLAYSNVAEHTLRVCWISMILARRENASIEKVVRLAMIHDLPEIRTGDVNYLSRLYVERHEDRALADMADGVSIENELTELWREYRARESLEAKIVKDADTLDVDFELKESSVTGGSLLDPLRDVRNKYREKLFTSTAKLIFDELYRADPHAWHVAEQARLTGDGDDTKKS